MPQQEKTLPISSVPSWYIGRMLKALGVDSRSELLLLIAIVLLVAVTPTGREATAPVVFLVHRLLLVAITLGSLSMLKQKREPEVCPIYISLCGLTLLLMLASLMWNPGPRFSGFYRWYQYLFFGAAFLAMAAVNRERSARWKRSVLWSVVGIGACYVAATLIVGKRPLIGPFVNPNYFASFLIPGLCAAVAFSFFGKGRAVRIVSTGFAAFLYYGMTQAASRGATLAAMAVAALAIVRFSRGRRVPRAAIVMGLVSMIVIAIVASPTLISKFLDRGSGDPYNYQRPKVWMSALRIVAGHPVAGIGLGQFHDFSKRYSPPVEGTVARYLKRPAIAHSEYLQSAAETGIPATLLFFTLGGYLVLVALRRARTETGEQRVFQEAAILTATGLGLHALVDNNWSAPVMAAGLVVFASGDVLPLSEWRLPAKWPPRAIAIVSMVFLLIVGDGILLPGAAIMSNESGRLAYDRDNFQSAEAYYQQAVAFAPDHYIFLDNAGVVYFEKFLDTHDRRWLGIAETLFTHACDTSPNADEPRRRLERLVIEKLTGDRELDKPIHMQIAAINRDLLRIEPFNPFVRMNLAEALYNSGRQDEAERELATAVEIEPNYVTGYMRLAQWLAETGDAHQSEEYRQRGMAVAVRYQNLKTSEPYETLLLGRPQVRQERP